MTILSAQQSQALTTILGEKFVAFDFPMSRRTTLKIGGPADAYCTPDSIAKLQALLEYAAQQKLPVLAVGAGSNLLVKDGGIRGIVLSSRSLRGLKVQEDGVIYAEAGVSTGAFLKQALAKSLGGCEFLGGVPGSLGGGLRMNAGTYLGEFIDITERVISVSFASGERIERVREECGFGYRTSTLPVSEMVVAGWFQLFPRDEAAIRRDIDELRKRRKEREPSGVHNSGSTFKNPSGDYAGRLIEACGLKGVRVGGAVCSPVHANWLVNDGDATAQDLLALVEIVQRKVLKEFGVSLELELKIVGEDD